MNLYNSSFTTNNGAETYHNELKGLLMRKRNCWVFIKIFNDYITSNHIEIQRSLNNLETTRQRNESIQRNFRELVLSYNQNQINEIELIERTFRIEASEQIFVLLNQQNRPPVSDSLELSAEDLPDLITNSAKEIPDILDDVPNELLEPVLPPSLIAQSNHLLNNLETGRRSYSEIDRECHLNCGRMKGNLILSPCGHSDYCLDCMGKHCHIDNHNIRYEITCPECRVRINAFIFMIVRN